MKETDISQVDALFADGSYPIEFLLYYRNRLDSRGIRNALKSLAPAFWPLFSDYEHGIIRFNGYMELDCFAEERCEGRFDPEESHAGLYESFRASSPSELKKLFHIQMIQYTNGTVLIPKINHLAGDGYSTFYFLSALAAVSRQRRVPFRRQLIRHLVKPRHGRTALRGFAFREDLPRPLPDERAYSIELERIAKKNVQTSIEEVASRLDLKISSNDVLSAMALKKALRLQRNLFGDQVQLTMPIDVRRVIPEYGRRFFGNGIMLKSMIFDTQEILDSSVVAVAAAIRRSLPDVSRASFVGYLRELETLIEDRRYDMLKPFDPARGCLVTNISRLPLDRLDFGSGRPDLILPLTIERNSVALLAEGSDYVMRFAFSQNEVQHDEKMA